MSNIPWVRHVLWVVGVLLVVLLAFIAFLYFNFQPTTQPTTSNLASVDCGAFKIELKEWVSNDPLTGRHVQRYFWYNPNDFLNGGKKISDKSSFPSMYAPEDFLLFYIPKEFSGLHLVLYEPSPDMPTSMTRMELNSSHSRNDFGYFNREEYVAVRDCLLNNREALAVSVRYPDVRNGGEFTASLLPLSVSFIPVRKNNESRGESWGPVDPTFQCSAEITVSVFGDGTVRVKRPSVVIGSLDWRGDFTAGVLDSRPEFQKVAEEVVSNIDSCRNEAGENIKEFYDSWRERNAEKFLFG